MPPTTLMTAPLMSSCVRCLPFLDTRSEVAIVGPCLWRRSLPVDQWWTYGCTKKRWSWRGNPRHCCHPASYRGLAGAAEGLPGQLARGASPNICAFTSYITVSTFRDYIYIYIYEIDKITHRSSRIVDGYCCLPLKMIISRFHQPNQLIHAQLTIIFYYDYLL
jgi:hypothetical protein